MAGSSRESGSELEPGAVNSNFSQITSGRKRRSITTCLKNRKEILHCFSVTGVAIKIGIEEAVLRDK